MPIDPEPTRQRLIDAATRRFAERGVDAVSLAEINRAAGQRNASALQYHFGGREGLLRAVLAPYAAIVAARRRELLHEVTLASAAEGRSPTLRQAVEVLVRPLAEAAVGGWRERALSRIVAELHTSPHHTDAELDDLLGDRAVGDLARLLVTALDAVPPPVRSERLRVAAAFVVHAASDRARAADAHGDTGQRGPARHPETGGGDLFVENLIDMVQGALAAPVSRPTIDALAMR